MKLPSRDATTISKTNQHPVSNQNRALNSVTNVGTVGFLLRRHTVCFLEITVWKVTRYVKIFNPEGKCERSSVISGGNDPKHHALNPHPSLCRIPLSRVAFVPDLTSRPSSRPARGVFLGSRQLQHPAAVRCDISHSGYLHDAHTYALTFLPTRFLF